VQKRCSPKLSIYTVDPLAPSEQGAYPCNVPIEACRRMGSIIAGLGVGRGG